MAPKTPFERSLPALTPLAMALVAVWPLHSLAQATRLREKVRAALADFP